MAISLDNNLIIDLDLASLNQSERARFLRRLEEVLEYRVGVRVATTLSARKLDEFEALMPEDVASASPDDIDARASIGWLEQNVPKYRTVVQEEFKYICTYVKNKIQEGSSSEPARAEHDDLKAPDSPQPADRR